MHQSLAVRTFSAAATAVLAALLLQMREVPSAAAAERIGQVATRGRYPTAMDATRTTQTSRVSHFARDDIAAMKLVYLNYFGADERPTGGVARLRASIEYPRGVFTRVTCEGRAVCEIADGGEVITDAVAVTVPRDAEFREWVTFTNPAGVIFAATSQRVDRATFDPNEHSEVDLANPERRNELKPSGLVYGATAIVAKTAKPSFLIMGDSRASTDQDATDNDGGDLPGPVGKYFAYINIGVPGERLYDELVKTRKRRTLAKYVTSVAIAAGINDLNGSSSTEAIRNLTKLVDGFCPLKDVYPSTIEPQTEPGGGFGAADGSDQRPNVALNARRLAFNRYVRGGFGCARAYFDLAQASEFSPDSGKWKPNMTSDGLHGDARFQDSLRSGPFWGALLKSYEPSRPQEPSRVAFAADAPLVKGIDVAPPIDRFAAPSFGLSKPRLDALKAAGFNTLRCFISLRQFMLASRSGALADTTDRWMRFIRRMTDAGFHVVVSWNSGEAERLAVLSSPTERNDLEAVLGHVASALGSRFDPSQVALEIMNEPPPEPALAEAGAAPWATRLAPRFFRAMRRAAPRLTVIVQSAYLGWADRIADFRPTDFDANTIYSFHPYQPGEITHQGIKYPDFYRIPYPFPTTGEERDALKATVTSRVNSDASLTPAQKEDLLFGISDAHGDRTGGYLAFLDAASAEACKWRASAQATGFDWAPLSAWAKANGIDGRQIIAGEFGIVGDVNFINTPGADLASRANFLRDTRKSIEFRGWGGWIVHQAFGDFAIFEEAHATSGHSDTLTPELRDALFGP